jgi:hypothetical protein
VTDPRDKRWEDRADRAYTSATDHPWRMLTKVILFIVVIAIVIGIIGWIGGWFSEAGRVTGVENVRQQTTLLRQDYESLKATAANACDAEKNAGTPSPNDPQIVSGDPALQYKATYRSTQADYDRRMTNAFEAGIIKGSPFLSSLPNPAPTLAEMQDQVC